MINLMLYKNPDEMVAKVQDMIKKDNAADLFAQALLHFVESDFKSCESAMKNHLINKPDDPYALHVLGFTQIDDGRPEDGLETLLQLLDIHPDFFPALNHTGYAYLRLNQNDEAMKYFRLFLESDSLNPSAHDSYADGLESIGDYDKAIAHLSRAILLDPNFAYGWNHMGDIFKRIGEKEMAIYAYKMAKKAANLYGKDFISSMNEKIHDMEK
jgi:tetratricopeptide (TPR) repeat protein